ncbi:MAG TPA: family 43 glycosylhydrolase [Arachnia sp.]|nr:family 43 glycosylhydrolase [Arachnia sp.]HMT87238.1 family 43 glycosylhydrolase [Arachnia sp.]
MLSLLAAWVAGGPGVASAAEQTVSVSYNETTAVRGIPLKTYYEGVWASNSTHAWAENGAFFEIPFTGESVALYGRTSATNGTAEVYVDDELIGTADYNGARVTSTVLIARFDGLDPGDHVLRVVAVGWVNHARADFTATVEDEQPGDLRTLYDRYANETAADYTTASWAPFAQAHASAGDLLVDGQATLEQLAQAEAALRSAVDALVMISGLRDLAESYATRVPADYDQASWATFAAALTQAHDVVADPQARAEEVVAAKNGLQDAAAALVVVDDPGLATISNNRFWHDTDGNPIFSQGGGVFRFGDRYYWYGVRYAGAQAYYDNPTRNYSSTGVSFEAITAYSSTDLVNWTFENNIATTGTPLHIPASQDVSGTYFSQMNTLADAAWIGRLGVVYNENTGKYVLLVQFENQDPQRVTNASVLFLEGDAPGADFRYANIQTHIPGVYDNPNKPGWNQGTGDQTVFTDDDGTDYLVFSYRDGRSRTYVAKISDEDSLSVENAVEIYRGAGREGNAMFKLDGHYFVATSDLHGWNSSQTYLVRSTSTNIQGSYTGAYVLPGTEKDYSHVTQSGFFIPVNGTEQDTVVYAGDRWADFAWNGLGYNQWVPLSGSGADVRFHSLSDWAINATTGEWQVGLANNYVLNPDFAADRIAVSSVTGWTTQVDPASSTGAFVSNPSPGASGSRFALQVGADAAFSGSVFQDVAVPAGRYRLGLQAKTSGALAHARVRIAQEGKADAVLELPASASSWTAVELGDIVLGEGSARISIEGAGAAGAAVVVDQLSLRQEPIKAGAELRCVAGKVVVAVQVGNHAAAVADVQIETSYGAKGFAELGSAATRSAAFSTRQASIPAGAAGVTALIGGEEVSASASYPAKVCG